MAIVLWRAKAQAGDSTSTSVCVAIPGAVHGESSTVK
jgi:hypothetical protein